MEWLLDITASSQIKSRLQIVPSRNELLKRDEDRKSMSVATPAFLWKSTLSYRNQQAPAAGPSNAEASNEPGKACFCSTTHNSCFSADVISLCKLGFRHVGAHARCEIISNCKQICALTIKVFK